MCSFRLEGFTPLSVVLAERLSYRTENFHRKRSKISIVEKNSSSSNIDEQWRSVELLILIHLLKRCRTLITNRSLNVHFDQTKVYSSIQSARKTTQKFYLRLLKKRQIELIFTDDDDEKTTIFNTYERSSDIEFSLCPRLNIFDLILMKFSSNSTLKFLGKDLFAFELVQLVFHLCSNEIFFYRIDSNQSSLLPLNETNARLVTLVEIFSKTRHSPVVQRTNNDKDQRRLHLIDEFHRFRIDYENRGELTFERISSPEMPIIRTANELKNEKRTYLKAFRQRSKSDLSSTSRNFLDEEDKTDQIDSFPIESTFFIVPDTTNIFDAEISSRSTTKTSNSIGNFSQTASSMIQNIYETLRKTSDRKDFLQLRNLFLSIDHELCVLQRTNVHLDPTKAKEKIYESVQHDLKHPIENLHDLHKIIQRSIDVNSPFYLDESQIFQNDALDLQSLLLFFDPNDEIPQNELQFLFTNEENWFEKLLLPSFINETR